MQVISIVVCIYCHPVNSKFSTWHKFQLSNNINACNNLAKNGVHITCTLHQKQESKHMHIIQIFIVNVPRKNRQHKHMHVICIMYHQQKTHYDSVLVHFLLTSTPAVRITEDPLTTTSTHWTRTGPLHSRGHTGIGNRPCSSGRFRVHGTPLVHTRLQVQVERTSQFKWPSNFNFLAQLLNSSFIFKK